MYLGQTTFSQDRMSEFITVAKELDIREIGETVNIDEETSNFWTEDLQDPSYHTNKDDDMLQDAGIGTKLAIQSSILGVQANKEGRLECSETETFVLVLIIMQLFTIVLIST